MKSRLNGNEYSALSMLDKICGKSEYSKSVFGKCLMGLGDMLGSTLMLSADRLGLWNDRAFYLYRALQELNHECSYPQFCSAVINLGGSEWLTQDMVIACKSVEDFKELLRPVEDISEILELN